MKSSEKKCVSRCVDRWIEALQIVSKTLVASGTDSVDSFDEGMMGFDNSLTSGNSGADDDWKSWK